MANNFRRSVDKYWIANTVITFVDDPCCNRCPMFETYARKQCRMTGEYIDDGHQCGWLCPLDIEDKKTNIGEVMRHEQDDLRNG